VDSGLDAGVSNWPSVVARQPRSERSSPSAPTRQGRQVAGLSSVAGDRCTAWKAPQRGRPGDSRLPGIRVQARWCSHTFRHLQGGPSSYWTAHEAAGRGQEAGCVASRLPPHHRGSPARGGVEVNVICAWLGHVSLDTTNRYAEVNIQAKEAALRACEPPAPASSPGFPRRATWRDDQELLRWLDSL